MLTFRQDSSDRLSGMRKHICLALLLLAAASGVARAEPVQIKPGLQRLNGNLELPAGKTAADGVVVMVHGTLSWYGQETIAALQKNLKAQGHWLPRHHPVARHRRPAEDPPLRRRARLCGGRRQARSRPVARVARRPGCQDGRSAGFLARRGAGGDVRAGAGESAPRGASRAGLCDRRRAGRDLPARLRPSAGTRDRDRAQEPACSSARSIF